MDRSTISHLLALYITDSCYTIIPYFNGCMRSSYPITINCQNKEIRLWCVALLHFGKFKKDRKRERAEERKRTGGKEKSSTYPFTWEGMPRGQPQ